MRAAQAAGYSGVIVHNVGSEELGNIQTKPFPIFTVLIN